MQHNLGPPLRPPDQRAVGARRDSRIAPIPLIPLLRTHARLVRARAHPEKGRHADGQDQRGQEARTGAVPAGHRRQTGSGVGGAGPGRGVARAGAAGRVRERGANRLDVAQHAHQGAQRVHLLARARVAVVGPVPAEAAGAVRVAGVSGALGGALEHRHDGGVHERRDLECLSQEAVVVALEGQHVGRALVGGLELARDFDEVAVRGEDVEGLLGEGLDAGLPCRGGGAVCIVAIGGLKIREEVSTDGMDRDSRSRRHEKDPELT
jgi:hypothetical protein